MTGRPNAIPAAKRAALNRYANLLTPPPVSRYASAYLAWLAGGAVGQEPERGPRVTVAQAAAVRQAIMDQRPWG